MTEYVVVTGRDRECVVVIGSDRECVVVIGSKPIQAEPSHEVPAL